MHGSDILTSHEVLLPTFVYWPDSHFLHVDAPSAPFKNDPGRQSSQPLRADVFVYVPARISVVSQKRGFGLAGTLIHTERRAPEEP